MTCAISNTSATSTIARTVVAMCKKDLDNLVVKDLKSKLKTLEKEKKNLLVTLKSGTNQKVKEIIFDELEKLANQEDEIKKQIVKEELQHVRLDIPQVKFFFNDLKMVILMMLNIDVH